MNSTSGGTITVAPRLSFDGGLWEVTELTATVVVLRDALGAEDRSGFMEICKQAVTSPPWAAGQAAERWPWA